MKSTLMISALVLAASLATISGFALAAPAAAGQNDAVADLAKARITLVQAANAAEAKIGGRAVGVELESESGTTAFEVEVVAANRAVYDVKIDATSGKVLSSELDKADNGDEEEGEEKDD